MGSKKNPIWRIVVADKRSPRDGRTIETIGQYNPQTEPSTIVIEFLVRALVEDPEAVVVEELEEDGDLVYEVTVAEGDLGRVIGKGGRVANAIRTIAKAAAVRIDRRVIVDILD